MEHFGPNDTERIRLMVALDALNHRRAVLPCPAATQGRGARSFRSPAALHNAHLRVLHGGMRLTGQDFDAQHRHLKQAWWVVPMVVST